MRRRDLMQATALAAFVPATPAIVRADTNGVTDKEIRIGGAAG